jgi:hypothetical protein
MSGVTRLADEVLPLIRTRADLHRWRAADEHGAQMQVAVARLREAVGTEDPKDVRDVTERAIASALKVIMRADDSSGIIGDAVRELLDLHPGVVLAGEVPFPKLVDWMIRFQFDDPCDFFSIDPVAYAPALGEVGVAAYRRRLDGLREQYGPRPPEDQRWSGPHAHEWFVLDWNARRLAVLDHDIDAIIATHARDRRVAAWLEDTAEAFEEIGEVALAIDWARQAAEFDRGHQSLKASARWCRLLAEHRPEELVPARSWVFQRWPSSSTAAELYRALGPQWPEHRQAVLARLAGRPADAVGFALRTLQDPGLAWELAHRLELQEDRAWSDLARAYERIDPVAVLPVLARLVAHELVATGAEHYRIAARHLVRMRRIAAGTDEAEGVDALIAELREANRRRPRLRQEFDRAGLP